MTWEPDPVTEGGFEISEEDILDGDNLAFGNYPLGRFILMDKEYVPKNAAERRWKDDVDQKIEAVINNVSVTPGTGGEEPPGGGPPQGNTFVDTGWFWLRYGMDKVITHNFGQIVTRFSILCSSVKNPGSDNNIFFWDSGIRAITKDPDLGGSPPDPTFFWSGMVLQTRRADQTYVDALNQIVIVAGGDYVINTTHESIWVRLFLWR